MNLQQLEYIAAVDRLKSFSKAAEACHITQATLSTMIRKLEDELGVVLFDRKTSPIITTDCGKEIIAESRTILFHANRLKILAADSRGRVAGTLKLGIIPTIAANLLHRLLPVLMEKYPDLHLQVEEITTANIIRELKAGTLDAGIVSTPLNQSEIEEDILYYEKLLVYGNMAAGETRFLSPKDISNERIWLLEQGNCLSGQVMQLCALHGRPQEANLQFQPNSFDSLLNMVDTMDGLTLLPELYVFDMPEDRKLRVHDFSPPFPVREISLIYHRPYAKLRLLEVLGSEIIQAVKGDLQTTSLRSSEMNIARLQVRNSG
jgi:LysR family hydrogen peroxide-inducible transcriptional activator